MRKTRIQFVEDIDMNKKIRKEMNSNLNIFHIFTLFFYKFKVPIVIILIAYLQSFKSSLLH